MMKIVGFDGGPSLNELGPAADVQFFFDCVTAFVLPEFPQEDWSILTDRLYRRYLRQEELAPAQVLMNRVKDAFGKIPTSLVNWDGIIAPSSITRLNPSKPTLGEVFSGYFERFSHCRESAQLFFDTWRIYQPLRIVASDMPAFIKDKNRALDEYDSLVGEPFWKR